MEKLLVINASARMHDALSRNLSQEFVKYWKDAGLNPTITFRELGNTNLPHITEKWLQAASKSTADRSLIDKEVLKYSDVCIEELREADIIILATPMYNFSIPSTLKAYIDQVMRVNETFTVRQENDKQLYSGLLQNKILLLLLTRGGQHYAIGQNNAHRNFQNPYLDMVFGIMGINNIHEIFLDGTAKRGEQLSEAIKKAHEKTHEFIQQEIGSYAK